jgi:hypothetical protein
VRGAEGWPTAFEPVSFPIGWRSLRPEFHLSDIWNLGGERSRDRLRRGGFLRIEKDRHVLKKQVSSTSNRTGTPPKTGVVLSMALGCYANAEAFLRKVPLPLPAIEIKGLCRMMPLVGKGVIIQNASCIGIYDWGLIMERTTQASVGTDPWTVIQNKLHPAVAETEFTPLDWSCLRPSESLKQNRRRAAVSP